MAPASIPAPMLSGLLAGLAPLDAGLDRRVQGIASDSRQVRRGDLFLAMPGNRVDGRDYVGMAIDRGAVAILVAAQGSQSTSSATGVPVIPVPALKAHAGEIAARFYGTPAQSMDVIGVTGTNGKTTVSHLIAHALTRLDPAHPCGIIGTVGVGMPGALRGADITTPDPIALQASLARLRDSGARAVAMEVSSHALDQHRVAGVRFAAAVFTNLTRDHLDYHRDMDSYGVAKARLFHAPGLKAAVINVDDDFGRRLLASLAADVSALRYTLRDDVDDDAIRAAQIQSTERGMTLSLRQGKRQSHVRTRLHGRFNAANLLAAFGALLAMDVPWREAVQGFDDAGGVPGRMEPFGGAQGQPLVLVDYAHTPDALEQVLRAARALCRGRLWCVFGCGGNRDPGKRPLMGAVAAELADEVIVTSDNPRAEDPEQIIADILSGVPSDRGVRPVADRSVALMEAIRAAEASDVVVVAGKGHEDYQEIRGERMPFSDRAVVLAALRATHSERRG